MKKCIDLMRRKYCSLIPKSGSYDIIKFQCFKNAVENKVLEISNQSQRIQKMKYLLNKSNRYQFSNNTNKKNDNQNSNSNRSRLEDRLDRMIFSPKILLSNLKEIIENQLSLLQLSKSKDNLSKLEMQGQKEDDIINIQHYKNIQLTENDNRTIQISNIIKISYMLRNFMVQVLQLDQQIAVMNEIDYDEDYKLDTTFKIIEQIYSLHKMLQSQLQPIFIESNQRKQSKQTYQQSKQTYQKAVLLLWCQIINFTKLLQLAPNDKSFHFVKFALYFNTWKQRFQYFKQGLPLGVHIRFFGRAVEFSQEILKNIMKIQSMKLQSKQIKLDSSAVSMQQQLQGKQNQQKEENNEIRIIMNTLLNITYKQFLQSQKINHQEQQQRMNQYIKIYKQQLDQYHTKKLNNKKQQRRPQLSKLQIFFQKYSQQKRQFMKDKEYIIQQRERRIQVNFRFVEVCVLTMFSRQIQHQDKIDKLNDYRNAVHRQYQIYQQSKQNQKIQKKQQSQTKKYNPDRKNRNKHQQTGNNNKLQQTADNISQQRGDNRQKQKGDKLFGKFIAKNFMQYLRANIVATWTIYRAQDLASHQFFKKDNTKK